MEKQYYLITGNNEGIPMEPYIINNKDNSLGYHLQVEGDCSRRYTPITPNEVIDKMRSGVQHI